MGCPEGSKVWLTGMAAWVLCQKSCGRFQTKACILNCLREQKEGMFLEELPTVLYEQQNLKTLGEILAFYPETWLVTCVHSGKS